MVIVNIFSKLSPGYCNTFCQLPHILYIVTWLLYPFSVHCHIVIVTIFCTLSHGYCYHILYIVTWLLLPYSVHCHMVIITIFSPLSHGYCHQSMSTVTCSCYCQLNGVLPIVVMYIRLGEQKHGGFIRKEAISFIFCNKLANFMNCQRKSCLNGYYLFVCIRELIAVNAWSSLNTLLLE